LVKFANHLDGVNKKVVIRRTSEFGYVLLQSLAKGWESIPLYHSGQVHPDFSTMIDKGDYFIDYFPLYGLFW
jgi:hypothetical protein